MALLSAGLAVIAIVALCVGQETIPLPRIFHHLLHSGDRYADPEWVIVVKLRLPRLMAGVIAGAALALAGAIFQGLLRNPLAEPFILGISGGAAIGVCAGILLEASIHLGHYSIPFLACGGALFTMFLIYQLSRTGARFSIYTMILAGVIVNAICSAFIMFFMTISTNEQLHSIIYWLMGRLDIADTHLIIFAGVLTALTAAAMYYYARDLNILTLGEDDAHNLGVDVERVKRVMFFCASLLTACAVTVGGIIGFVGLLVPHFARALVGPDHRLSLPVGMLSGALLLCLADLVARTVISPSELPVGVVTALVGGPFFLIILRRRRMIF